jgi:hypothetical protein
MSSPDAEPRRRLPDLALVPVAGGAAVPVREHRRGAVLVLVGDAPTDADAAFLGELAGAAAAVDGWDARVLVVVGGDAAGSGAAFAALAPPFRVLADPGRRLAAAAGVGAPALVVADQWGEVHWTAEVGAGRGWPATAEVEQWARYLAIRCAG